MKKRTSALEQLTGAYGPKNQEGMLTENLVAAHDAGLRRYYGANGGLWLGDPRKTHRLVLAVCSELVTIYTEDGGTTGRCGKPAIRNESTGEWIWCEGHDMPDWGKDCEHGLSLALCFGPGHYPMED